jgi:sporulation protein YlmC with PRC-barrel domain
MKFEDLRHGVDVVSADGHKLGSLSRVVVQKDTLTITHIVVDTGILRSGTPLWEGGWGLGHDRVVPFGALARVTAEAAHLTMKADEFRDLSIDYDTKQLQPLPDAKPGQLDASDLQRVAMSIPGEPGAYVLSDVFAKAPDEVDIRKDSAVWRLNPHEKIGEVERVEYDGATKKVTQLVIRRGHFFSKDVILPVSYIVEVVEILEGVVRVDITDEQLEALAEFHAG